MMEHARWFPYCAYARQLCGDELYQKIQESKRMAQGFFSSLLIKGQAECFVLFSRTCQKQSVGEQRGFD